MKPRRLQRLTTLSIRSGTSGIPVTVVANPARTLQPFRRLWSKRLQSSSMVEHVEAAKPALEVDLHGPHCELADLLGDGRLGLVEHAGQVAAQHPADHE